MRGKREEQEEKKFLFKKGQTTGSYNRKAEQKFEAGEGSPRAPQN
jgi:hypothetical protein